MSGERGLNINLLQIDVYVNVNLPMARWHKAILGFLFLQCSSLPNPGYQLIIMPFPKKGI